MGIRYAKAPIIEAACEFRFEPTAPWDLTIPGLVYEKIREQFPKRRAVKEYEASMAASSAGAEQRLVASDLMQFLREDERSLVMVGRDFLAVSHLKPYPSWNEFLPLIQKGFDAYCGVTNPKGMRRIGLRYINRIEFVGPAIPAQDYFHFRPFMGPKLPQSFVRFRVGVEIPYEDPPRDILRLQLISAPIGKADDKVILLDLDYFLSKREAVSMEGTFGWIEVAHNRVEEAFEASITDRLRETFEEVRG